MSPFDMRGTEFLLLYTGLLAIVIVAGFIVPLRLRPQGHFGAVSSEEQLAYLSGGKTRFAESIVARLLATRALVMHGQKQFSVNNPAGGGSAAERSVLALIAPITWGTIESALKPQVDAITHRLGQSHMLVSSAELASLRFWATFPYLALLGFGAIKWVVGDLRDKPVGFLTVALIVTLVLAAIRYFTVDRRTRAGIHAVQNARLQSQRLQTAPTALEMGLAVALFGTVVLAGSGFDDFHKLRAASSGSSDSGSGGDSDGGGGCGGGCGGCS